MQYQAGRGNFTATEIRRVTFCSLLKKLYLHHEIKLSQFKRKISTNEGKQNQHPQKHMVSIHLQHEDEACLQQSKNQAKRAMK